MAALDESMGFGFGAIGGAEQSINLGAIDWSPPPKRSHSARQMPPPRARQMPPSIVVDISPADARAAELVRQANCAVATKIKIKPGTQSGDCLVFKGKGAPRIADGGRGDQKIEFIVETPVNLSKDQRNQLETFGRIDEDDEVYPQRAAFMKRINEAAEKAEKAEKATKEP